MSDADPYADVQRRLDAMVADPFGAQMLRDLVPRGKRVSPALAAETWEAAVRRAMDDSNGLPAFLAVAEADRPELTLLVVDPGEPGRISLSRPGDWATPLRAILPGETLGEVIAMLRASNEGQGGEPC